MRMATIGQNISTRSRPIPHPRWWICGVLFASTVIIECQTLSWLAPYLKQDSHWTNTDYANLVIGFRVAYAIGQFVWGRLMDRVGTRRGLTLSVLWYSLVSIFTPLARGFYDFAAFRCWELENPATGPARRKRFPNGSPSANAVWQPLFSTAARLLAGPLPPTSLCLSTFGGGGGQPLLFQGCSASLAHGTAQLSHAARVSRISESERQMILADSQDLYPEAGKPRTPCVSLLRLSQTWGTIVAKGLTDPGWFCVTDWFPIYLVAKGIPLKSSLVLVWVPFIASDLGNFFGGRLRLSGQARLIAWRGAKGAGCIRRLRCAAPHSYRFHIQAVRLLPFLRWPRFPMRRFPPLPMCCPRTCLRSNRLPP